MNAILTKPIPAGYPGRKPTASEYKHLRKIGILGTLYIMRLIDDCDSHGKIWRANNGGLDYIGTSVCLKGMVVHEKRQ